MSPPAVITPSTIRVGVISDTHGLLRPEAIQALQGSTMIVHAGDVGSRDVLDGLQAIAPTYAVRGNVDRGAWTDRLAQTLIVAAGKLRLYVLHDVAALDVDVQKSGFAAVIFGHSHRPSSDVRDGVLFLNPGAAGPRRFTLPVTLARLTVAGSRIDHETIPLLD